MNDKIHGITYGKDDGTGSKRLKDAFKGHAYVAGLDGVGFPTIIFDNPINEETVRSKLDNAKLASGGRLSEGDKSGFKTTLVVGPEPNKI